MSMSIITPPKWCANAVLSKFGWVNEKSGEIYVRIKGIKDSDIEAFNKARYPEAVSEIVTEAAPEENLGTDVVIPQPVVEEVKSTRKRKSTKLAQE